MNVTNMNRRKFFHASLLGAGAILTVSKTGIVLNSALAADPDATVTKQNYIHDASAGTFKDEEKDKKKFAKHEKKITKYFKKAAKKAEKEVADLFPKASSVTPNCSMCKHYKKPDGGYGECAMVGAKGDVKVFEKGWCKVWSIDKKKVGPAGKA